jgi:hypothetical protein
MGLFHGSQPIRAKLKLMVASDKHTGDKITFLF